MGRNTCLKDGCFKDALFGKDFCSPEHARLLHGSIGRPTGSTTKKESSTPEPGDPWAASSEEESETPRDPGSPIEEPPSSEESGSEEQSERSSSGLGLAPGGPELPRSNAAAIMSGEPSAPGGTGQGNAATSANGTSETPPSIPQTFNRGNANLTQQSDSTPPLSRVEKANLDSLSLIDSSVNEMHELMQLVVRSAKGEADNLRIDSQKVNAACNTAAQMTKMMRLKLDLFKALKGKEA